MTRKFVLRLMAAYHTAHDDAYYFDVADHGTQKQVFSYIFCPEEHVFSKATPLILLTVQVDNSTIGPISW